MMLSSQIIVVIHNSLQRIRVLYLRLCTQQVTVEGVQQRLKEMSREEWGLFKPEHWYLEKWDIVVLLALLFTATVTP